MTSHSFLQNIVFLMLAPVVGHACLIPGPFDSKKIKQAEVVFWGRAVKWEMEKDNRAAVLVTFDVEKTINGPARKQWVVRLTPNTNTGIPASLEQFQECYGQENSVAMKLLAKGKSFGEPLQGTCNPAAIFNRNGSPESSVSCGLPREIKNANEAACDWNLLDSPLLKREGGLFSRARVSYPAVQTKNKKADPVPDLERPLIKTEACSLSSERAAKLEVIGFEERATLGAWPTRSNGENEQYWIPQKRDWRPAAWPGVIVSLPSQVTAVASAAQKSEMPPQACENLKWPLRPQSFEVRRVKGIATGFYNARVESGPAEARTCQDSFGSINEKGECTELGTRQGSCDGLPEKGTGFYAGPLMGAIEIAKASEKETYLVFENRSSESVGEDYVRFDDKLRVETARSFSAYHLEDETFAPEPATTKK